MEQLTKSNGKMTHQNSNLFLEPPQTVGFLFGIFHRVFSDCPFLKEVLCLDSVEWLLYLHDNQWQSNVE